MRRLFVKRLLLCRDDTKTEMEYIVRKLLGLRYPLLWLHFKMVKFNGEFSELNFLQPEYSIYSDFGRMMEDVDGLNPLKISSLKCFVSASLRSTML